MKRRRLLLGVGLGPLCGLALADAPALPAVLQRPATLTPLAPGAALLTAVRTGKRLVVGGERGIVLWSDDNGQQWTQARVPVQVSLTAMAFANDREGWASGHFGTLLRTTDGGQTWSLVMDGARAAQLQLDAATDDAARKAAQTKVAQGADKPFFDLALLGGRLLAVGAYGLTLTSSDGKTFEALGSRLPNPKQLHVYSLASADKRVFAVGEQGLVLRSLDAGASFEPIATPYKGSFFGVLLTGEHTVVAYGLRGNIWRSADNGSSWSQVSNPVPVGIGAGSVLADGRLVLLAQNGDLLVSRDDGQQFERRPAAPPFPAAAMAVAPDGQLLLAGLRGLKRQVLS